MKIVAKFTAMILLVICFFLISSSRPVGLSASGGQFPQKPNIGSYDNLLKSGEEMEIILTDDEHNRLQSFLKSGSFNKINRLRLFLEIVIFEDDIMWSGGDIWRRDPDKPNRRLPIDK